MHLSASQIKSIRALATKKGRDEQGLFVIEGEKMVREALDSPFEVTAVWRRDEIGEEAMGRISQLSTPSPVLAIVRIPESTATMEPAPGLYLALDSIRDPGNLGTIMRIADWFGVSAVAATPDTVDIFSPKVVQATMGAIFRVPFRYCDIPQYLRCTREAGGVVYGTFLDGEDIYRSDLSTGDGAPVVIVVGNEAHGISPQAAAQCDGRLLIPSWPSGVPTSESLNAAVATAVTVAEFRRRLYEQHP